MGIQDEFNRPAKGCEKNIYFFVFFLLGAIIGSFLNVCIYRLPRKESIVFPPSRCPHCGKRLAPLDMVPIISFFLLRGRCRYCQSAISPRYPLVETLTGVAFASAFFYLGFNFLLLKYLVLICFLIVISLIDIERYLIPNILPAAMLIAGIPINALARDITFLSIALGMFAPAAVLTIVALASRGGIGGGDIKLAGALGMFLGWPGNAVALFLGCILAGVMGLVLLLTRTKKRKDVIPFGPFLAVGAVISIVWGERLLGWYLKLVMF
jgi:leader peptidase (prepilin peptidase)/N-methyltransferase